MYPVDDVEKASEFYRDALGLSVKFVDGSRYAALDGTTTTFALAGPEEQVAGTHAAVSFKVADVAEAIRVVAAAGGTVIQEPAEGPHEIRAVVADPWGNAFVVYGGK
jgi:predicted enzyme related to lactoylglutathione lyase